MIIKRTSIPILDKETNHIIVDSETNFDIVLEDNQYLLNLGNLRTKDQIKLSILVKNPYLSTYGIQNDTLVKSKIQKATYKQPSDLEKFWYPFGFWMFVILMFLGLFIGLYVEYIMDPQTRVKLLEKDLKKLQDKISE